ncbi:AfsR/SARP family transcriptional regulator [Streptomyces chartreusis]
MDAQVHYSVLGTVRAVRGRGTELDLGPPKRLALLSLLVLRAPGPVSLRDAMDVLWDDEPPVSAVNVIHRNIGALRRLLEPGLRSRAMAEHLARSADGYRLLLDTSTSDLIRFRDLRAQAQSSVKNGDAAQAAVHFTDALRLWRSPVVSDGTYVAQHPVFTSVRHEFVATAKEAADVALAAAPAATEEVLTALRRAVEVHPFDEALHSHIIAALASTGRRAEALEQFERIRRTLADDLGVEPGPGPHSVHQRFLRRRHTHTAEPGRRSRPALDSIHLPEDSVPFVGRAEALNRCQQLLTPAQTPRSTATIIALCGLAGVGKTTLAVQDGSGSHFPREKSPPNMLAVSGAVGQRTSDNGDLDVQGHPRAAQVDHSRGRTPLGRSSTRRPVGSGTWGSSCRPAPAHFGPLKRRNDLHTPVGKATRNGNNIRHPDCRHRATRRCWCPPGDRQTCTGESRLLRPRRHGYHAPHHPYEGVNGCDQPVNRHAPSAVHRTGRVGPGDKPTATGGTGPGHRAVEAGGGASGRHPVSRRAVRGPAGLVGPARAEAP